MTSRFIYHFCLLRYDVTNLNIAYYKHPCYSPSSKSTNQSIKTRDAQASLGYPTDASAMTVAHRMARPFLDVVLPQLTRSTYATLSVHGALHYDLRHYDIVTHLFSKASIRLYRSAVKIYSKYVLLNARVVWLAKPMRKVF